MNPTTREINEVIWKKVTNYSQFKVGDKIKIVGDEAKNSQIAEVFELIDSHSEVIIDVKKNRFFNAQMYLEGRSWVKDVYIQSNQATGGREMSEDISVELIDVSEWEIFIDDLYGEIGMKKVEHLSGRKIEVVAKEEIMPLYNDLESKVKKLEKALKVARRCVRGYMEIDVDDFADDARQTEKQIKEILGSEDE